MKSKNLGPNRLGGSDSVPKANFYQLFASVRGGCPLASHESDGRLQRSTAFKKGLPAGM
jgi:hypothetical protein